LRRISAISGLIATKFCVRINIHQTSDTFKRNYTCHNSRWWQLPSLIWIFCYISVGDEDIRFTFGWRLDIDNTVVALNQNPTFVKIQDGGDRQLEFEFLAISQSPM